MREVITLAVVHLLMGLAKYNEGIAMSLRERAALLERRAHSLELIAAHRLGIDTDNVSGHGG
jgi:predicted nucleotidyltransferase